MWFDNKAHRNGFFSVGNQFSHLRVVIYWPQKVVLNKFMFHRRLQIARLLNLNTIAIAMA